MFGALNTKPDIKWDVSSGAWARVNCADWPDIGLELLRHPLD